jgi:putative alpha-1,2-mannosidase
MGDREQFNIMPSILDTVNSTPDGRKLSFVHENEIAKPDYYSVTFDNGIQTEIAPASHSAIFRITSPSDKTSLIFDSKNGTDASFDLSENGVLKGYVNNASGMNAGASKMFIYAEFSQDCETIGSGDGSVKYAAFNTTSNKTIIMKIATSYMNEEQAHKNLQLEITNDNLSFDQLHSKATDI